MPIRSRENPVARTFDLKSRRRTFSPFQKYSDSPEAKTLRSIDQAPLPPFVVHFVSTEAIPRDL
jgi:hypothetical protein